MLYNYQSVLSTLQTCGIHVNDSYLPFFIKDNLSVDLDVFLLKQFGHFVLGDSSISLFLGFVTLETEKYEIQNPYCLSYG